MERLIFHIDVNSAFLSWEAVRRVKNGEPDLRLIPSCVGGDPESRHGIVTAKSIPAKKFGVETGEPIAIALRKCPGLVVVPSDFKLYTEQSRAFKAICRQYTPIVEEFSIDECFLDVSGSIEAREDPVALACEIKDRIRDELGFTVNVGVARNKLCAKMASDFEKPDKVHTLFPDEIPSKLWPLPVRDLLFIGKSTAARLTEVHIRTIGDLAHADMSLLTMLLGENRAAYAHQSANGIDDSPVRDQPEEAKGYSNSVTLEEDVTTLERADTILLALADSVTERMRNDGAKAGNIAVTIRYLDFTNRSHQRKLASPVDTAQEVYTTAKELLRELWRDKRPLRLMSLALGDLVRGPVMEQGTLFDVDEAAEKKRADRERAEKLDRAADAVRGKFGFDAIQRGSVMGAGLSVGKKYKARHDADVTNQ